MTHTKLYALAITASLLTGTSLYAADLQSTPAPAPQIRMVSGGIGDGEIDAMKEQQNSYSVKLIFAESTGEYLSNVNLQISDKHNTIVNTASVGPIVLLDLKPGNYTLSSSVPGDTKSQCISVRSTGLSTYIVHLHSAESQSSAIPAAHG